jgi:flavin-dependent dehydrogenase
VGDAGYFKDPVSSHGITDAFIGAELLARSIGDTLVRGADEREALAHFQAQRDSMAAAMMPPLERVASFEQPLPKVEEAFRDMSLAMRDEWLLIQSTFD